MTSKSPFSGGGTHSSSSFFWTKFCPLNDVNKTKLGDCNVGKTHHDVRGQRCLVPQQKRSHLQPSSRTPLLGKTIN